MKRFYYIELLRFIAAMSVILWHYQTFFKPFSSFSSIEITSNKLTQPFYSFLEIFYNHGHLGVPLFWSISGFVFAHVYLEEKKGTSGKEFFINRFARLYPLHFATLMMVAFLQIISFKFTENFQIYNINDLYHFLLHLFFISGWGFQEGSSFNNPIWSVSVELVIYAFFFISIFYLDKYKIKFAVSVYILLLIMDKSGISGNHPEPKTFFFDCAKLFFSGIIVFFLYQNFKKKLYLIAISIVLILLSFVGNFKAFLFFPSVLLLFAGLEMFIYQRLKKPFQFFGNLTYALYLLHIPVQVLIILIFGYFNFSSTIFLSNYIFIFYILLMILLSFLCFEFYEKPLNKKIRSFFS